MLPQLHHARNLSVGGLLVAIGGGLWGGAGAIIGVALLIAVLGYVQFWLLPRVFALAEGASPSQLRAARLGAMAGAIGWALGAVFGVVGVLAG